MISEDTMIDSKDAVQVNVTVVIIEDDPLLRDILTRHLTKSGCTPYATGNGSEAIGLVEKSNPHVIVLDLMLPEMSGEEILKLLKSSEAHKRIPIIAFSNRSEDSDVQKILNLGASAFLVKASTELSELTDLIRNLAKQSTH
jgi:DNA-binding response OmpR family regulator